MSMSTMQNIEKGGSVLRWLESALNQSTCTLVRCAVVEPSKPATRWDLLSIIVDEAEHVSSRSEKEEGCIIKCKRQRGKKVYRVEPRTTRPTPHSHCRGLDGLAREQEARERRARLRSAHKSGE
jgi:hypothetical protein